MKKLLIVSNFTPYSVKKLAEAAETLFDEVVVAPTTAIATILADTISITVNHQPIESFNKIIFKTSRQEVAAFYDEFYRVLFKKISPQLVLNGAIFHTNSYPSKTIQSALLATAGLPIIPTRFGEVAVSDLVFPCVLKETKQNNSRGVYKLQSAEEYLEKTAALQPGSYFIQQFIPKTADYRVVILNQQVLGFRKKNFADQNELLTKLGLETKLEKAEPERAAVLAELAKQVGALGFELAGVDVIFDKDNNPHILEINDFPGYESFSQVNPGVDVANELARYLYETAL